MRLTLTALLAVAIIGIGVPAFAELQNVEVGGAIRIRGNFFTGGAGGPSFDDTDPDTFSIEQRTLINVKADFTDDVTAFIEIDSYNVWGDDFRGGGFADIVNLDGGFGETSEPVILWGFDNENETEIGLYQAYIEMREAGGYPIDFRIGRQEIMLGSEWLVGNNDTAGFFRGLSFDAVVATYNADQFSLTGLWARLSESNNAPLTLGGRFTEQDDDVDLYALYASYTGLEDMTIDGYYIFARAALTDDSALVLGYGEASAIHTVGLRFAGTSNQFDWDVEGAAQFGDSGFVGIDQSAYAFTADAGYTFDINTQPRVFVKGSYYSGDDSDAPFNRLFSDHELSEFLGNTDLSNIWTVAGGVSAQVTEAIGLTGVFTYYQVVEDYGMFGKDLGYEVGLYATYDYSEDLYFEAGYAHFFTDSDVAGGSPVAGNGLFIIGGGGAGADDDLNYVYVETGISF